MKKHHIIPALGFGLLIAATPMPAYAYIDPGIGSMLFQSVVAGFVALSVAWAGLRVKIGNFFSGLRRSKNVDEN